MSATVRPFAAHHHPFTIRTMNAPGFPATFESALDLGASGGGGGAALSAFIE
jgi:hypothetical protein